MKRITKVLSVFISLMMVIGLLLPMGGIASATDHTVGTSQALIDLLTPGVGTNLAPGDTINLIPTNPLPYTYNVPTATGFILKDLDTIKLNLNTHTLNLNGTGTFVLELDGTTLEVEGTGTLNIRNLTITTPATRNGLVMSGESEFIRVGTANTPTINISATGAPININTDKKATLTNVTGNISNLPAPGNERPGPITVDGGAEVTINGVINSTGPGLLVKGSSDVTVTGNISATASPAISAEGSGTEVKVTGNVTNSATGTASAVGIHADGSKVTVTGTVTSTVTGTGATGNAVGVHARNGSTVTVTGTVTGTGVTGNAAGIHADGSTVTVTGTGNVTGSVTGTGATRNAVGVQAWNDAEVNVSGRVTASGATGTGAVGVLLGTATGTVGTTNEVRVSGTITAPTFIRFQSGSATPVNRTAVQYDDVVTIASFLYREYTNGAPGRVLVRTGPVPTIKGNGTIDIPAIQSGNTITLNISNPMVEDLIRTATGTNPIRLDLASASATAVTIPTYFFARANEERKTVQIDMPEGSIFCSSGAMHTLGGQQNTEITFSLHVQNVSLLPPAQRNAINATDLAYRVTATSGSAPGTAITSFAGDLTITLDYSGPFPADVYHVNTGGVLTLQTSTTSEANESISFSRRSLSIFIIRLIPQTPNVPETPNVPQTGDNVDMIMLGMVAFAAVSGLVALVVIKKSFMTDKTKE